jgi:hypothetical protein
MAEQTEGHIRPLDGLGSALNGYAAAGEAERDAGGN